MMTLSPRVYVSARVHDVERTNHIQKFLGSVGYETSCDWTTLPSVNKPYLDPGNIDGNRIAADEMRKGINRSEAFVLLNEPGLQGGLIELGMFLGNHRYLWCAIIGNIDERPSIFWTLPDVYLFDTVEEFEEWINAL